MIVPAVRDPPDLVAVSSVNHRFPSGPAAMPSGPLPAVGSGNSVIVPDVVIRPILSLLPP